jgi:uncharacterized protein
MLTPDLDLAREFVAANPPRGRLLLCAVSGSHTYGFPSADSDLDLKGIHLVPTRGFLGLRPAVSVHDLTAFHRGVECDLTTNEAGQSSQQRRFRGVADLDAARRACARTPVSCTRTRV